MGFQAPTSMTGRDPGMGSVAYTSKIVHLFKFLIFLVLSFRKSYAN